MKLKKLHIRATLTILFLIILGNCHYYRIGTVKTVSSDYIFEKDKLRDYLVVHVENDVWHLQNVTKEENLVHGTKMELAPNHQKSVENQFKPGNTHRYKKRNYSPTNEVHIFVTEVKFLSATNVEIDVNNITRMEVYDEANEATIASYVGTTAVVGAAFSLVFLAIACGCPDVYVYDGSDYLFQGGIFPGAINTTLERDDYKVLEGFSDLETMYRIKLANEKPEKEFIDLAELIVIQHPFKTQVIYSKSGEPLTFANSMVPDKVEVSNGEIITQILAERDEDIELFNHSTDGDGLNALVLTFNKPRGSKEAKLLLTAKNSHWMDYTFNEFFSLFGDHFKKFQELQKQRTSEEHIKWQKEQGVVLNVYLDKGKGWEYYDYFNVVGSASFRDIAMRLNVQEMTGDKLKVKLESGFGFWELDYAAIDFGENIVIDQKAISPLLAKDQYQQNFGSILSKTDGDYLEGLERGDELFIEFDKPVLRNDLETSIFLHSKGYYELELNYEGKPNLAYLKKFRKKGRFSRFSRDNFLEILKSQTLAKSD